MAQPDLPRRRGDAPETTDTNPHKQLGQHASREHVEALATALFALPDAVERPSRISVPGARALVLAPAVEKGPQDAFMTGREFCHLHPPADGSLHMCLPPETAALARDRGWAEPHPVAGSGGIPATTVMVYGPRSEAEVEVVTSLVRASYRFAGGEL